MRPLLLITALVLTFSVHAQDGSMAMRNVTLWYEAFNKRNVGLVEKVLSETWVDIPPAPGQPPGLKGVELILAQLSTAFPDFQVTPKEILQDGNKVIVRSEISGTHRGFFMGIPSKERKIAIQAIDIHEVENGKILRTWHTEDWLTGLHQMGAFDK